MENLLYSALITYGIVLLITQSSIIGRWKEWIKELEMIEPWMIKGRELGLEWSNCVICSGFWIGCFVGAEMGLFSWWNVIGNGGLLVATTYTLHCLMGFLGRGYDPSRVVNVIISKEEDINT